MEDTKIYEKLEGDVFFFILKENVSRFKKHDDVSKPVPYNH